MASFPPSPQQLLVLTLAGVIFLIVPSPGAADLYTSTQKILEMAASEGTLLEGLNKYIASEYDNLQLLSQFLMERSKTLHESRKEAPEQLAHHPNGAYLLIQNFSHHWTHIVSTRPGLRETADPTHSIIPTENDCQGSRSSLLRLQRVYRLSSADMYAGNYLGHEGPALRPVDTFLIGRQAFLDGFLPECIQWLSLSVSLLQDQAGVFPATTNRLGSEVTPLVTLGQAAALLGRAYIYMDDYEKAEEMYQLSYGLDPKAGDVVTLRKELDGETVNFRYNNKSTDHNMTVLCLRPKHEPVAKMLPIHVCRYKRAFGTSYLRFKEEILSTQPYVSVFYDVIHDDESDSIKQYMKGKMTRGMVGEDKRVDNIRTSDTGWIHDQDLSTAAALSQRVKLITGLEVDQRYPNGPSSGEAMQVVNYGLGGYYDAHTDPLKQNGTRRGVLLNTSGFRIATFLMYLSEVEMGGNTVFLRAGISVAPRKGMALFWYNFAPDAREVDKLTQHAGCPVVIGEKWVANKWIWTYGNTFRRPCGPYPNSTQLHLEQLLAPSSL